MRSDIFRPPRPAAPRYSPRRFTPPNVSALMSTELAQQAQDRINSLCKPPGSLGELERLAVELCRTQQTLKPQTRPRRASIFAADHGVCVEGVTAWPSEVTAAVVEVMRRRRTASGVLAQTFDCQYEVVDVGLLRRPETEQDSGLISRADRRCTGNLLREPAMSPDDFEHALAVGRERAEAAHRDGCRLLIGGEMGIGNTTSASCLVSHFCELPASQAVGRGAGVDDAGLIRKKRVVEAAVDRARDSLSGSADDPITFVCEVGGLEIAALIGFYQQAASRGITVLIDGFIATAAAVAAETLRPGTSAKMIAAHKSAEPGHRAALERLELHPLLDLEMRLGEATGALAALPLLDACADLLTNMATLEELSLP